MRRGVMRPISPMEVGVMPEDGVGLRQHCIELQSKVAHMQRELSSQ